MKAILLISDPRYDTSLASAAADSLGLSFRHVRFWEQVSGLTVTDDGKYEVSFEGVESNSFSVICVSAYPEFAIPSSHSKQFSTFLQAEWVSALNTYIYLHKRPVLNAELLGETCNFNFSSKFLLPLLHNCGWKINASTSTDVENIFFLLIGWRCFQSSGCSSSGIDISSDLLYRTYDGMRLKSLDFLILRAMRSLDGRLYIARAPIVPPPDLPKNLWEVFWNEFSIC